MSDSLTPIQNQLCLAIDAAIANYGSQLQSTVDADDPDSTVESRITRVRALTKEVQDAFGLLADRYIVKLQALPIEEQEAEMGFFTKIFKTVLSFVQNVLSTIVEFISAVVQAIWSKIEELFTEVRVTLQANFA